MRQLHNLPYILPLTAMISSSEKSTHAPDINDVISVIGSSIFSFLPLGSLLNGYHSPILVNRTFHDGIFVSLGQSETLDLSQCSHLRKITDDQLITLMRKIVDITKASALDGDNDYHTGMTNIIGGRMNDNCGSGGITCQYSIQLTHINFSNCRRLSGESIHYCLRHTPNLKR